MYYIELNKLYFRAGDATEDTVNQLCGAGPKTAAGYKPVGLSIFSLTGFFNANVIFILVI